MTYQCPQCHASYEVDENAMPRFCQNCGTPVTLTRSQTQQTPPKLKLVAVASQKTPTATSQSPTDDFQEYPVEKAFFFGVITLGILPALKWSKTTTAILNTFREEEIKWGKRAKAMCAWWGYAYIFWLVFVFILEFCYHLSDKQEVRLMMCECILFGLFGHMICTLPWEKAIQSDIRRKIFWSIGIKLFVAFAWAFVIEVMPSPLPILIVFILEFAWIPIFQSGINMAVHATRTRLSQQQ